MKSFSIQKQQGIALIASLLMLLVMTLIGLTALERTTIEEKMAANSQQKAITFQAAETAIQQFISTSSDAVYTNSINSVDTTIAYHQEGDAVSRSASLEYLGETIVLGNSIGDLGYEFELTGVGSIGGTAASSTNVQGMVYIMPGGG
ncbi:MAG TPA: hypothetical protein ENJ07_02140 [Gammaproteobacteria bacterium]|nr:hypothetical protein [Gammaproteobacteria bacterium]